MASSSFAVGTSMDVPQTQNTAPVLEFRCLYTQDLRRKQKRWQDGRLKFHTFNKRVMVYDERSNFVGDTHWREDTEFDEGEELELERGGILVEVGECVGKRNQDLYDLVDKRVKERQERAAAKIAASSPSRPPHAPLIRTTQASPAGGGPLQHKPLNSMLAPTGHYGRAVVPQTSPFDEKQRFIRDAQGGTEMGRPTKRRKQTPSKNGYAQNLMGATLNLAFSKPPNTAKICYEPVITRLGIGETPAATIDLTGDDNGKERNIGARRVRVTGERDSGARRGKDHRRLERSPARSGFASNLTGVSLTLSRPGDFSSRRSNKSIPAGTSVEAMLLQNNDSSSKADDANFMDIKSVATKFWKEPKQMIVKSPKGSWESELRFSSPIIVDNATSVMQASNSSTRQKVKSAKEFSALEDSSSSPTKVEVPLPIRNPTRNVPRPHIQNSAAVAPTSEQAVSALRIKARPPRKMMMLMDRPSSRSSTTVESSSVLRQQPQPPANLSLTSNEVVLSQATIHLNSFCKRQQEIIQARLNGKCRGLDLADPSSSPEDGGIDHQTIDLLLTRKSLPVDNKTKPWPNQASSTGLEHKLAAQSVQPCLAKGISRGDVLESQPRITSRFAPTSALRVPRDDEEICPRGQNLLPRSNVNSDKENPTSQSSVVQYEKNSASPRATSPSATEAIPASLLLSTEEKKQRTLPNVSQTLPRIARFPENFSSTIQAATEHFRAMIKSSASSTVQLADVVSSPPHEADNVEISPPVELSPQKDQTASCDVLGKLSPRSSLVGEVSNVRPKLLRAAAGSDPGKGLEGLCEEAVAPVVTGNIPKARLVNPATRGKSLQTLAANTVDSLAPVFGLIPPPPPPRITTHLQRNLERNVAAEEGASSGGYVGERTIAGPWSRESFDLFGSWLPPGIGGVVL